MKRWMFSTVERAFINREDGKRISILDCVSDSDRVSKEMTDEQMDKLWLQIKEGKKRG